MRNLLSIAVVVAGLLLAPSAGSVEPMRDPTRPTRVQEPAPAQRARALTVSAVFISGDRRLAIVNGQRVREGDAINGATVREIEADKVSFLRNNKILVVPLLNHATRK
ncbi:MAG: hypothetical protein U5K38_02190 [Woeseiaceae bacterium]|nr:hypothetical protein [Woeseiaceae bacterium]